MLVHSLFDLLAWIAAAVWIGCRGWLTTAIQLSPGRDSGYFIALSLSAITGAVLVGSLNLDLAGQSLPGHSIAGALFGGAIVVKIFNRATGMRGSTGVRLGAQRKSG